MEKSKSAVSGTLEEDDPSKLTVWCESKSGWWLPVFTIDLNGHMEKLRGAYKEPFSFRLRSAGQDSQSVNTLP